jgi:hypothetical protein
MVLLFLEISVVIKKGGFKVVRCAVHTIPTAGVPKIGFGIIEFPKRTETNGETRVVCLCARSDISKTDKKM